MGLAYADNAVSDFHMTTVSINAPSMAVRRPVPPAAVLFFEPSVQALADEMAAIVSSFAELQANWDGYGAIPVNRPAIDNAKLATKTLFKRLPVADIFPNPHGTITFEWENERGTANLEIGDTRFSFFLENDDGVIYPLSGKANEVLPALANSIYSALYEKPAPAQATSQFKFQI